MTSDHNGSARIDSLVVATFPWYNKQMVSAHNLADVIPADNLSDMGVFAKALRCSVADDLNRDWWRHLLFMKNSFFDLRITDILECNYYFPFLGPKAAYGLREMITLIFFAFYSSCVLWIGSLVLQP